MKGIGGKFFMIKIAIVMMINFFFVSEYQKELKKTISSMKPNVVIYRCILFSRNGEHDKKWATLMPFLLDTDMPRGNNRGLI